MPNHSFREQLRRNAVALISLVIALTSLGYNTWRNEHSEFNRNQRQASFQLLVKLGELQELVFLNHYDCNRSLRGTARSGWVILQTIEDLTLVLEDMPTDNVKALREVWQGSWAALDYDDDDACRTRAESRGKRGEDAALKIRDAVQAVRADALAVLQSLS